MDYRIKCKIQTAVFNLWPFKSQGSPKNNNNKNTGEWTQPPPAFGGKFKVHISKMPFLIRVILTGTTPVYPHLIELHL